MNRIFRIVWSQALQAWVVTSELARRRGKGRARAAMALVVLCLPAHAADRYWDVNGTAVGFGGTGTWNTTGLFWSPNADGVSGPYAAWNNAALDNAIFGGTAGTVTLGAPITVHNLTFNANGYVLTGNTLTLAGVAPTVNINSGAATIASSIAGTAGLTKTGGGHLHLQGNSTFSGGIALLGGRLVAYSDASLGAAGNGVTMADGTEFFANGAIDASRVLTISGTVGLLANGGLNARVTGTGGVTVTANGTILNNDASDYTGQTRFGLADATYGFTSIADLGIASALGAPTTAAAGTVVFGGGGNFGATLNYLGDGDSSNRLWQLQPANGPLQLRNAGSGTLTLTGDISAVGAALGSVNFAATSGDLALLGVIGSNNARAVNFTGGGVARTITLGNANTYTGTSSIANVTVQAGKLSDAGIASSLGAGSGVLAITNGALHYTGAGDSSNRTWSLNNAALRNNGSGALALGGNASITGTVTLGGNFTGAPNVYAGILSGTGGLAHDGAGTWVLAGANTYTGATTVGSGTLRAGSAQAFGTGSFVLNGGTLDLNGFAMRATSLAGTGGVVALGSGTLTLDTASGTTSYAGSIAGSGGLTKRGGGTQTLTGGSTYTGATTIEGGTLRLDFSAAGGPASNILSSASLLRLGGGTLAVVGEGGTANAQAFNGVDVLAGSNTISATSGTGGSATLHLGAIAHTGGLVNFVLPASGSITTSNALLGGWATVNGTDYAKVVGGNITAFTASDYVNKDNAATWLNNEIITDTSGFFGTVGSTVQIGGLRYTRPVSTTVTVASGQTLGVDGTIIVAPTVATANQRITGGNLTGTTGGGVLGIQQNSTGNFTIDARVVDNGGSIGFTKAGAGLVTLGNNGNSYTGATTVGQGILSVTSIGNGGVASAIGASSADASNLLLQGSTLRYTGASTVSDRGFTLARSGAILAGTIEVTNAAANLGFTGQVTSADGAGLTKTGAGTLTLGGTGNDYTGATTITGGTLSVGTLANGGSTSGIGAAGNASANLVLNGGELEYTGATTASDRGFTLGANGGAFDVTNAATTLTLSGTGVGTGVLRKWGAGTLVLSGNSTYSGGTVINAGTVRLGSSQGMGTGGLLNLASTGGATLDLNGFNTTIGPLSGGGPAGGNILLGSARLTINVANCTGNGVCDTYGGVISGSGGVTVTGGGGGQTMTGCRHTYTGATIIGFSTNLVVDCLADGGLASGIGASGSAPGNLAFNGGQLSYTGGSIDIDRGFQLATVSGSINVTNAATVLGFGGQVTGGGALNKVGAGTLLLSGNNTYTGTTNIAQGTLRVGSSTAVPGTAVTMSPGATFDLNGFNTAIYGLEGSGGTVELDGATLTFNQGGNLAFRGAITGAGGLVKNGATAQQLFGCNSNYTGPTVINAGAILVDCLRDGGLASSLGASSAAAGNVVINGGQLSYVGTGDSTNRQLTIGTASPTLGASGSGAILYTSTAPLVLTGTNAARTLILTGDNTGNNTLAAQLTNNGTGITALTKQDSGTWVLTNNSSTYTGPTSILGGVLVVDFMANGGAASAMGASSSAASNLVIGNGATLRYIGSGNSTDRLFTLAPGVSFIESSGTGAINFTNTAAATYTGLNQARTLALGGTNTGLNTMGGTITNAGSGVTTLAKNDSGTWVLTGNNTYSGNTVINDGNLVIGNGGTSGNAGTGNVIIDSATSTLSLNRSDTFIFSGTLSGPGTLAQIGTGTSTLTAANNSVGATTLGAGTLDVNGGLTTSTIAMAGTSTLNVDGTVQASGATPVAFTGDAGNGTIHVNDGGVLRANGDLGAGTDAITLSGTLDTGAAMLDLGADSDTFTVHEGATLAGIGIDGGSTGVDLLAVDNTTAMTLDGLQVGGFEQLDKQGTGVLAITNPWTFSAGVFLDAGTLEVVGRLATPSVAMADDTVLDVRGTVEDVDATPILLAGSAGTNTLLVGSGATLRGSGDLGEGNDAITLAGTLETGIGVLALGAGDDVLTLADGADLVGTGVDAGVGAGDQLVLDNAMALDFDGSQATGFESLLKQDVGTATMTGSQAFVAGTTIAGGTLDVDGMLETPLVALADGTALQVDGLVQAAGATQAFITGSTGANTIAVGSGATLLANGDLGTGNDVLDVAGTLDTGAGAFVLGDGDDTLTIHEHTRIIGTVVAGTGNDAFDMHIDTVADLGAVQDFETLRKTGTGVVNLNGPLSSDFIGVEVLDGTLDVTAAGIVVPAPGNPLTTVVGGGARLNVDGSYGCGDGNDMMTVAGTVSGSGTIDLCGGDDTLVLQDGVALGNAISGGAGVADTLVLDSATAFAFDAGNTTAFEFLQKTGGGTATLTGTQDFVGGTALTGGTLQVEGTLQTPTVALADGTTLRVGGTLQASVGTLATIRGDAGANTVAVEAGGLLLALADLGAGDDVLDVAGTLDLQGGVFALGDGDDNFVVHDGTVVLGTVDGGAGMDSRTYDIDAIATLGALTNFEGVTKTGAGVLELGGPGATDLQDVQVLEGTLDVFAGASIVATTGSPLNTVVAAGATLNVDGSYGCGDADDTMTVSGTVGGAGTIDLCGGDDVLTLRDGAVLATIVSGGAHGPGDTVVLDVASSLAFDAARTIRFESLRKENAGIATLSGDAAFIAGTALDGGVLDVQGALSTPTIALGDDTTLRIDGSVQAAAGIAATLTGSTGTNQVLVGATGMLHADADLGDGNDTLLSHGTVTGSLAFGTGDDHAGFFGADVSDLVALDGGDGANDRLTLGGMLVNDDDLPLLSGWERGELLDGTTLQLDEPMILGHFSNPEASLLVIDATSRLVVREGAQVMASVSNAGTIEAGAHRLAIGGAYTANGGALQIAVSPASGSSGGLDIAGDVSGTTAVTFTGDGTEAVGATSILVIESPNDDLSTPADFATGGVVRLAGSALPWSLAQAADRNWYLDATADALLPEIGGYAVLPTIGRTALIENNRLLFQRLSAVREDTPRCGTEPEQARRAYWLLTGDCHGLWMAATASELEVGPDPGFAFSGDSVGLFLGADVLLQDRDTRTLRGGVLLGFQRGNHWTTGANSTAQQGIGESNVRTDTPVVGLYQSIDWRTGTSLDVSLVAHRPKATIAVGDGFRDDVTGSSLTFAARLAHRVTLANGWRLEPQLQFDAIGMHWSDDGRVDERGQGLHMDDDVFGIARAALRAARSFDTAGGARVKPWVTLGVQDTVGEKADALAVAPGSGLPAQAFPNHAFGLAATLDAGVEAELNAAVSVFGVLSLDQSLDGTDAEQRQANLGVRIRW